MAAEEQEGNALPPLVRGYADRVLPSEPRTGRTVRVVQVGEMVLKPGATPRRFSAVEDFRIDQVEFAWHAHFPIIGPLGLRVTDSYDGANGLLEVRLLGLPLQRKRGPALAEGEAFRYLAELAWIPEAIVTNHQLRWRELDARTVEVATTVENSEVAVRLSFNERGDIERTVAERPRLEADGAVTRWIGDFADYRVLGGARIPTCAEVRWELPEGPYTYWRGTITSLELRDEITPRLRAKRGE